MDLTLKEVSALFSTTEKGIADYIRYKNLPSYEIDNVRFFNKHQVVEWALDHNVPLNISVHGKMVEYHIDSISAMLDERVFFGDCDFSEDNYIESMVGQLILEEGVDRKIVEQLLKSREALMSTAIGNGISLPHPRIPLVIGGDKPVVSLFFPRRPLNLKAPDSLPVHTLILIISQSIKQHLSLLAHLSFLLSKPELRDALESRKTPRELLAIMSRIELTRRA